MENNDIVTEVQRIFAAGRLAEKILLNAETITQDQLAQDSKILGRVVDLVMSHMEFDCPAEEGLQKLADATRGHLDELDDPENPADHVIKQVCLIIHLALAFEKFEALAVYVLAINKLINDPGKWHVSDPKIRNEILKCLNSMVKRRIMDEGGDGTAFPGMDLGAQGLN